MACFDLHNPLFFKTIYKPDSIFDFKIRVALLINWHKTDLNAEQRIQKFSVKFGGQLFVLFCFFASTVVFITSGTYYKHLKASFRNYATASSCYNTPCK